VLQPGTEPPDRSNLLTPREGELLRLIANGLSNIEIARQLVVSEATVKTHLNHLLAKAGWRGHMIAIEVDAVFDGERRFGDRH
jgi:DNA-binding NarL/FixJ family response regulator